MKKLLTEALTVIKIISGNSIATQKVGFTKLLNQSTEGINNKRSDDIKKIQNKNDAKTIGKDNTTTTDNNEVITINIYKGIKIYTKEQIVTTTVYKVDKNSVGNPMNAKITDAMIEAGGVDNLNIISFNETNLVQIEIEGEIMYVEVCNLAGLYVL